MSDYVKDLDELKLKTIELVSRIDGTEDSVDLLDAIRENTFDMYYLTIAMVFDVSLNEAKIMSKLADLIGGSNE